MWDIRRLDTGQVIHKLFLSNKQQFDFQHNCNRLNVHDSNGNSNMVYRKDKTLMSLRDYTPQQSHCPPPPYLGLMLHLRFVNLPNPRNKQQTRG
jgi:hypothetical protein